MVPTEDTSSLASTPTARTGVEGCPFFRPWAYAVDVTMPIVETGQAEHWRPNDAASWGWASNAGTCVFTGSGWALGALAVAGHTGLVHKD